MADARKLSAIRSWVSSLTLMQELSVLAGVILFLVGMATDSVVVRIGSFLLGSAAVAWSVMSIVQKRERDEEESTTNQTTEEQESPMKKLVFDDFQASGQYKIDFVNVPEQPKQEVVSVPQQLTKPVPPVIKIPKARPEQKAQTIKLSDIFRAEDEQPPQESGPKAEFNFLVKRVLAVVKEVNYAYSVALYWVNRDKRQLVLENFVSDSASFTSHRRRELAHDLVSQVAITGEPTMVDNLNTTSLGDTLPYYEAAEPVKTFVGVPIFYSQMQHKQHEPVAVLTVDCVEENAYGPETLTLLAQFTKLIGVLIQSYTDKYDLLLDSEVLRSVSRFREQMRMEFSTPNVVRSLAEETSRLLPWDYISVVVFDESRKSWIVQYVQNRMNDPYVPALGEIDIQQSLVGAVIQSAMPSIVEDVSALDRPRFYQAERCEGKGSLAVIPLISVGRCYGALVVESKDLKTYSDNDIKLIQKITETAAWSLEILNLTEVTNNFLATDETTGVATKRHFMDRAQEEVQRAGDFHQEISMVMISIDNLNEHTAKYGRDVVEAVLQNVGRIIKTSVRPYDIVGRFDYNQFAMLLVNTTPNEASIWAEKLRKNVASNVMNIDGRTFSVTISIGVSGASTDMNDIELLEKADRVLKKAVEAGGNIVRVFG